MSHIGDGDRMRAWAAPRHPRTSDDAPLVTHGEMYLFGSLAIVLLGDRLIVARIGQDAESCGAQSHSVIAERHRARRRERRARLRGRR